MKKKLQEMNAFNLVLKKSWRTHLIVFPKKFISQENLMGTGIKIPQFSCIPVISITNKP